MLYSILKCLICVATLATHTWCQDDQEEIAFQYALTIPTDQHNILYLMSDECARPFLQSWLPTLNIPQKNKHCIDVLYEHSINGPNPLTPTINPRRTFHSTVAAFTNNTILKFSQTSSHVSEHLKMIQFQENDPHALYNAYQLFLLSSCNRVFEERSHLMRKLQTSTHPHIQLACLRVACLENVTQICRAQFFQSIEETFAVTQTISPLEIERAYHAWIVVINQATEKDIRKLKFPVKALIDADLLGSSLKTPSNDELAILCIPPALLHKRTEAPYAKDTPPEVSPPSTTATTTCCTCM